MLDRPASGPPFDTSVVLPVRTRHCYACGAWSSRHFFLMLADKARRRSPHASADHPGRSGGRRANHHHGAPSRARGHLPKPTHPRCCRRGHCPRPSAAAGTVATPRSTGRRPARRTADPVTLRTAVRAPLHRPNHGGHDELRAPRHTRQPPTCAIAHCISLCAPPPPPRRCTFPTGPTAPAPTLWRQRRASPPLGCRPR